MDAKKYPKINDWIYVENMLNPELCKTLITIIKDKDWKLHQWYSYKDDSNQSMEEKECSVFYADNVEGFEPFQQVNSLVNDVLKNYQNHYDIGQHCTRFSKPRYNRYKEGTQMRKHVDHIHSIFDGTRKGIPILSIVGVLNDDYEGGQFLFNNDYEVTLKAGDILLFPSLFLYEHTVKEVKKGTRYSFVSWAF